MKSFMQIKSLSVLPFIASFMLSAGHSFFSKPKFIAGAQLEHIVQNKNFEMTFNFGLDSYFSFCCQGQEVYFEIVLGHLPDNYHSFLTQLESQYDLKNESLTGHKYLTYFRDQSGREVINESGPKKNLRHAHTSDYLVAHRREFERASPKTISVDELAHILKSSSVLFYTGAGLSRAADIPDMNQLFELLQVSADENCLYSLEYAFKFPGQFANRIQTFYQACLQSEPTEAHQALKALSKKTNSRVLTENLDILHEKTGVLPYRIRPKNLNEDVKAKDCKNYDYLICIGLSYDDKGFMGWYKENHPKGKIISLNLDQPNYLGDDDFLLKGDLQKVLPKLVSDLNNTTLVN